MDSRHLHGPTAGCTELHRALLNLVGERRLPPQEVIYGTDPVLSESADHQGSAIFRSALRQIDLINISQNGLSVRQKLLLMETQLYQDLACERRGGRVDGGLAPFLSGQLDGLASQLQRYSLTPVPRQRSESIDELQVSTQLALL